LIGRDEGPIGALLQQGLQGGSIGLVSSLLLLLLQVKALLQQSTH
jgi:tetrahydromethanopterin S-methyltransferase subunit F